MRALKRVIWAISDLDGMRALNRMITAICGGLDGLRALRRVAVGRRVLSVLLLFGPACATIPGEIHVLADADGAEARTDAVRTAARWVMKRNEPTPLRMAAARSLGRLRVETSEAVSALRKALTRRSEPEAMRSMAAWALGELRGPSSLQALTQALRAQPEGKVAEYVLEALAKHLAVMAKDEETLLAVVEGLVFYAGNRRDDRPAAYALLSERTRTVGVNVQVLARTVKETRRQNTARQRAALYNAAFELLTRLDERRSEMAAGPAQWQPRIDAAIAEVARAYKVDDLRTQVLVLYMLGQLATAPEVANRAAPLAQDLRLGRAGHANLRLIAAWTLNRLQLAAVGPRRALVTDVLTRTVDPELLRLLADMGGGTGATFDAPQRWLEAGGAQ